MECGTVEWNSGTVEWWNSGMDGWSIDDPLPHYRMRFEALTSLIAVAVPIHMTSCVLLVTVNCWHGVASNPICWMTIVDHALHVSAVLSDCEAPSNVPCSPACKISPKIISISTKF